MKHDLVVTINNRLILESISEMKWSYFNVYFLTELRDLYLVCRSYKIDSIPFLLSVYNSNGIKSENGKVWNKRNLLELTNALKKIGLISETFIPLRGALFFSTLGEPLTLEDKEVFRNIFYSYDRFKSFHRLFESNGYVIATKNNRCRFYNSFITEIENATEYYIPEGSSEIMRFWDVFLKWGAVLNEYDRCLFKSIGVETNLKGLGISWVYKTQKIPQNFSILEFATQAIGSSYISIIDLIWLVIKTHFFSIKDIKERILEECLSSNTYSLQSTSAIFIEVEEKRLLPRIGSTYMSHLLKLS